MILHSRKIRIGAIFIIFIIAYCSVIAKLIILQIVHRSFFTTLGDRQYVTTVTKTPERALIFDRHNRPLAINHNYMSAFIIPRALCHKSQTIAFLENHFPNAAKRLSDDPQASFMYIQRRLSEEQQQLFEAEQNPDLCLMAEAGRFYPLPCSAALIGITTIDNEGASGLELAYNEQLKGKPSTYSLKRDARNSRQFYFERSLSTAGHKGSPITTTIDSTIQFFAYEELLKTINTVHATEGAVIVMNPTNGEILAMVSYPDFNPNDTRSLIIEHMKNRTVTETYEFGSVIKIFLALAALAEKIVTLTTNINCYNTKSITLHGMKLATVHPHGVLTFSEVIQGSNNIGTAQVALSVGDALYYHYRKCGFGTATGTLPGEQSGYVTHPSSWSRQSLASLSYGYEIRATLLQLASAVCIIANNGIPVHPQIILDPPPPQKEISSQLYSPEVIEQIKIILEETITQGTAHKAKIKGYKILGKTGTANLLINGTYRPDHNIYTFAGIITKESYQRVIITFIKEAREKNLYSSTVAAPLFERIAERILIHEGQIASTMTTPLN